MITQTEQIEEQTTQYWRSRAKHVVEGFINIWPLIESRRGAFNFQEWQEIQSAKAKIDEGMKKEQFNS